jgi:hypothetical protein
MQQTNKQSAVSEQWLGKHIPAETRCTQEYSYNETVFSMWFVLRSSKEENWGSPVQLSAENQPVKRRLVGWCEMAVSFGPS